MAARRSRLGSGISISAGVRLLVIGTAFVVFAALVPTAHAADFRAVLCAANNGSNGFGTTTNTTSPQNPGGIFNFDNYCGGPGGVPGRGSRLPADRREPVRRQRRRRRLRRHLLRHAALRPLPGRRRLHPRAQRLQRRLAGALLGRRRSPATATSCSPRARAAQHGTQGDDLDLRARTSGPSAATSTFTASSSSWSACAPPAATAPASTPSTPTASSSSSPTTPRRRSAFTKPPAPLSGRPLGAGQSDRHFTVAEPARACAWSGSGSTAPSAVTIDHAGECERRLQGVNGECSPATSSPARPAAPVRWSRLRTSTPRASPTVPTPSQVCTQDFAQYQGSTGPPQKPVTSARSAPTTRRPARPRASK